MENIIPVVIICLNKIHMEAPDDKTLKYVYTVFK
jgi:hypothetical protein